MDIDSVYSLNWLSQSKDGAVISFHGSMKSKIEWHPGVKSLVTMTNVTTLEINSNPFGRGVWKPYQEEREYDLVFTKVHKMNI